MHEIEDPGKLFFPEETYQVVGAAMEVYYKLGPGFLEGVYQKALSIEFAMRDIPFREQARFQIEYKGNPLGHEYVADFFCFDEIIIEIKATASLSPIDWAQVINYLKASHKRVRVLFNFGSHGRLERKKLVI